VAVRPDHVHQDQARKDSRTARPQRLQSHQQGDRKAEVGEEIRAGVEEGPPLGTCTTSQNDRGSRGGRQPAQPRPEQRQSAEGQDDHPGPHEEQTVQAQSLVQQVEEDLRQPLVIQPGKATRPEAEGVLVNQSPRGRQEPTTSQSPPGVRSGQARQRQSGQTQQGGQAGQKAVPPVRAARFRRPFRPEHTPGLRLRPGQPPQEAA